MSTSGRVVGLLHSIDALFASVVMEPAAWDEQAFGEWLESAVGEGEGLDRDAVKILQRAVRRAQRLRRNWEGRPDGADDWRMRVDETLGSAGWRPGLELAEWAMRTDPDPELFQEYAERFRAVNFTPPAMTYNDWTGRQ